MPTPRPDRSTGRRLGREALIVLSAFPLSLVALPLVAATFDSDNRRVLAVLAYLRS